MIKIKKRIVGFNAWLNHRLILFIEAALSLGIIHADLSEYNVVVCADGDIALAVATATAYPSAAPSVDRLRLATADVVADAIRSSVGGR